VFDPAVSDQWWKNAVVYCVAVETHMDSDGDGIGDFRGLTDRLPYLSGLGVTCLWLLPFHPSPAGTTATTSPTTTRSTRGWAPSASSWSSSAPPAAWASAW
jgi:glycosidase